MARSCRPYSTGDASGAVTVTAGGRPSSGRVTRGQLHGCASGVPLTSRSRAVRHLVEPQEAPGRSLGGQRPHRLPGRRSPGAEARDGPLPKRGQGEDVRALLRAHEEQRPIPDTRIKSLSGRRPPARSGALCVGSSSGPRPQVPPRGTGCDRRGWRVAGTWLAAGSQFSSADRRTTPQAQDRSSAAPRPFRNPVDTEGGSDLR